MSERSEYVVIDGTLGGESVPCAGAGLGCSRRLDCIGLDLMLSCQLLIQQPTR